MGLGRVLCPLINIVITYPIKRTPWPKLGRSLEFECYITDVGVGDCTSRSIRLMIKLPLLPHSRVRTFYGKRNKRDLALYRSSPLYVQLFLTVYQHGEIAASLTIISVLPPPLDPRLTLSVQQRPALWAARHISKPG